MTADSAALGTSDVPPRWPRGMRLVTSVVLPCVAFLGLQFVALALHIAGTVAAAPGHRDAGLQAVADLCTSLAWLILIAAAVRLLIKAAGSRQRR